MKNKLLLWTALALTLSVMGCKTMEPRPETPADCTSPVGPAPTPPPVESVPDTGPVLTLPPSSHIVVGYCPATGTYEAMGVDTQARRFTFHVKGSRASQPVAFRSFYEARVPVTVYTQRVKLTARGATPAPAPAPAPSLAPAPPTPSPATAPAPEPGTDTSTEPTYDPCENIGDEPPPFPKPTGSNWEPTAAQAFPELSWRTAFALDAVSDPATPSTAPAPQ